MQLENQSLIDVILSQDGDVVLLGGQRVQHGYNTRGSSSKKYFKEKCPIVCGDPTINRWLKCPRSKAACAAFLGTDYNTPLWGVNLKNGACKRMVTKFMSCKSFEEEEEYLSTLERNGRYRTTGCSPPATGFRKQWRTAFNLFLHYPVDEIKCQSRDTFYAGNYSVQLKPLNPFPDTEMTFSTFLNGVFEITNVQEIRMKESKMQLWSRHDPATQSRVRLAEPTPPSLPDKSGALVVRPHGSVLHFDQRPATLVHDAALIRYLRCRGLRVRSDHPRVNTEVPAHPNSSNEKLRDIRYLCRGLVELTEEITKIGTEPITLEEEVMYGRDDPVPWVYVSDKHYTVNNDFKAVQDLCKVCDISEDCITQWYGICNANRLRANKLFVNGHLDMSTLVIREAKLIVGGDRLLLFQSAVTASQRVRSYNTLLAYNVDKTEILRSPASACDCVVHLGPGCSHEMCVVKTVVLLPMLRNVTQLQVLPDHVAALQRVAMTIEYAYGKHTIQRQGRALQDELRVPHALAATTEVAASTPKFARDVPTPVIARVREQLAMWISSTKKPNAQSIRIDDVQADTAREIAEYPRKPQPQLQADLMRERLYQAYLKLHVGGWEEDMPPLILYYLVYTRTSRVQRIRNSTATAEPRPAVKVGCKRCTQCQQVVRGNNTCTCPHCGKIFPGRAPKVLPPGTGNIKRCLRLYGQLPGRWEAQPWVGCDHAESIRVRDMGEHGMVGQYLQTEHEVGQRVKVRWARRWRHGVVVAVTNENYTVELNNADQVVNVTVLRANVHAADMTSTNSFFRIQKCERSIALVYGGSTKRFVHSYKGTWQLSPKSTVNKLVWTGGGHGRDTSVVWIRQQLNRTAGPVYSAQSLPHLERLPKKRKRPHYNQACACGDVTCNSTQTKLGSILVTRTNYPRPPTRSLNDSAIRKLPESKRRKILRSKKMQEQMCNWRRSTNVVPVLPPSAARVNELHYPLKFLLALKDAGKKQIPTHVSVKFAKEVGIYRSDLKVGSRVVVVPHLTAAAAREARKNQCTTTRPAVVTEPVVTEPVVTVPEPATTTAPAPATGTRNTNNVLVVGLVSHPSRSKLLDPSCDQFSETAARDQRRVNQLRLQFDTVYTMAPLRLAHVMDPHPKYHVDAKLGSDGALRLAELMRQPKQIKCIALEYVRMPGPYYSNMVRPCTPVYPSFKSVRENYE